MMTEIKRNNWSRFCKKFNATNQFRPVTVSVRQSGRNDVTINENTPFMGLAIARKGRAIDAVELFTGRIDAEHLAEPVVSVRQPARILLDRSDDGTDYSLTVEAKDGTRASVTLSEPDTPQQRQRFVEKVAYSMFVRRGQNHGNDVSDWLEAERRVMETKLQFVQ